ncbi:MAG: RNA polymerase sigma factor SigF [Trichodesmium sp. St11_bin5]|nr:RNA polymerase sigma factor SigF [Trichodesmium sp. St11_bin5]
MSTNITQELKSETIKLLQQYQQFPSYELRNKLVQLNVGLVRKEAYHWFNKCSETYDDLLQVGYIGLILAIERFDVSKARAFSSFATPYIRGEIKHYLRDKSPSVRIPRNWLAIDRQAMKVIQDLRMKFQGKPTDQEVASALGISLDQWHKIQMACRNLAPLSLDAPVQDQAYGSTSLGELVPDSQYRSFQLAQEDQIRLQQALSKLEESTRKVLEFVFLCDLTQKETAERMGISAVTVSRRVKNGLKCLQKIMQ